MLYFKKKEMLCYATLSSADMNKPTTYYDLEGYDDWVISGHCGARVSNLISIDHLICVINMV